MAHGRQPDTPEDPAAYRVEQASEPEPHPTPVWRRTCWISAFGLSARAVSSIRKTAFCLTAGPYASPDRTPEFSTRTALTAPDGSISTFVVQSTRSLCGH